MARGDYEEASGGLYARYDNWCEREHHRAYGTRRFAAELESRGYQRRHTKSGAVWISAFASEILDHPHVATELLP